LIVVTFFSIFLEVLQIVTHVPEDRIASMFGIGVFLLIIQVAYTIEVLVKPSLNLSRLD
jgi:hypothetical protein